MSSSTFQLFPLVVSLPSFEFFPRDRDRARREKVARKRTRGRKKEKKNAGRKERERETKKGKRNFVPFRWSYASPASELNKRGDDGRELLFNSLKLYA